MSHYLEEITVRIAAGVAGLPGATRERHGEFLLAAQRADGGFAGRDGGSDLYYTGFALRAMAVLGLLDGAPAERAARFLRTRLMGRESIVDFLSLIYGATLLRMAAGIDVFAEVPGEWRLNVSRYMDRLRRDDGGFAKGTEGRASSTYHTFLVLLCLELLDVPVPETRSIVRFLLAQRCDDGGFREIRMSKRAGTNPTAAAVAALRMLDALDEKIREEAAGFLAEMQNDEGGLRANTRIPIADLLSTFTGVLTLVDLGALEAIDRQAARRYAQSMEADHGGFRGAAWDEAYDVEYTFYGLGALALLDGA